MIRFSPTMKALLVIFSLSTLLAAPSRAAEPPPVWAARVPGGGAIGRVVVPAPGDARFAHLSWPKAVRAKDGTIVLAYIAGTFHGTHGGGSPAVSISTDGGRTFTPPQVLREFAKGRDYTQSGNVALGVAEDGALVLLAMEIGRASCRERV